ncbi:HAD-like protein [Aureobasidium melanogenum CBS 110374]|uniref:HAD-like protein n=1 Tax=Aureobasidium melanogenum (strain CBS 110374) TaxID=1043003 RepID=A0A074WMS7_AURM1|nr:HAD-like protein [Aureobasidium melanogenum CBS 110374]KEQ63751.1 HAD-like protein [Aureobasidium melanogenum CBS 110374]
MPIKTILFDFMGTCLDWHSHIVSTLPSSLPEPLRSSFALLWRQAYFDSTALHQSQNLPPEDIDHPRTHLRRDSFPRRERFIKAWHHLPAWEDVNPILEQLKTKGFEIVVFANGTTRLQLDLCKSSGLGFDMLCSSQMLGVYKPAIESYAKVIELLGREAKECVMVAAHAWTDDVKEDQEVVKMENEVWMEGMTGLGDVIAGLG